MRFGHLGGHGRKGVSSKKKMGEQGKGDLPRGGQGRERRCSAARAARMSVSTKRWREGLSPWLFLGEERVFDGTALEELHCLCAEPVRRHLASDEERERNDKGKCGETLRTE